MARRAACPGTVDRRTTPDVLRNEACSVRRRLEAVSGAAHDGAEVSVVELDAITTRLLDLRWRIERTVPARHGPIALQKLIEASAHLRDSTRTVAEIAALVAAA